jgi:hypothetical protein
MFHNTVIFYYLQYMNVLHVRIYKTDNWDKRFFVWTCWHFSRTPTDDQLSGYKGRVSRVFLFRLYHAHLQGEHLSQLKVLICVNDTGGKFATGVNDAGGNLSAVSTITSVNLPPDLMTPAVDKDNNIRLPTL